jgi:ABC-type antimicrobial peptide transport system permease subunit
MSHATQLKAGLNKSVPSFQVQYLRRAAAVGRSILRIISTMLMMGLSLLPLSSLLFALPAVNPSEAVLTDTVAPVRSWAGTIWRRLFALIASLVSVLALTAFSAEIISLLHLPVNTYYGTFLRNLLPVTLVDRLPVAIVEHWPHVLMIIYLLDLGVLAVIGKVPIQYNARNLIVRWPITVMTTLAFVVVVGLLTVMLAFVTGVNKTTSESGFSGNVMILSDGATDELFSNLGYGNVDNVERIVATLDENDRALAKRVGVKQTKNRDGQTIFMSSRETYCVINQQIPGKDRRRFVQLRILVDGDISASVHNLPLIEGEWFSTTGVDGQGRIQCVLGQGVAGTLGEDVNKKRLEAGDTFELGDLQWIVTGVMKTEGTTYGSEIWCGNVNTVTKTFGKENYTTLVLRVMDDREASARALAYHIRTRYQTTKLKAVVETEYFADLNKSNQQFLQSVIGLAIVMAIGGIFCVMITMFSAIAQRTKDIGVLRLLGFKRWQVLVSFLLESMGIAVVGGLLGLGIGAICNGFSVTSIASSGQGGGKSVAAKLVVNQDVILVCMLFTLIMGRLGGLVPALSAMRLKILEALR